MLHSPAVQNSPPVQSVGAPQSRQASASDWPQVRNALPTHSVAPSVRPSSVQYGVQAAESQTSPVSHAIGASRSRQLSESTLPQLRSASPKHSLAPAALHSSVHGAVLGTQAPCSQRSPAPQLTAPPGSRQASAS